MAPKILNNKPPEFFQPYLQKHIGLKIPDALLEHLNGAPKKAELRKRSQMEKVWYVKMEYTEDGVFFMDGWLNFVRDNSIEHRDMLFFRYDGNHRFDVRIFAMSGLEKRMSTRHNMGIEYVEIMKMEEEEDQEEDEEGIDNIAIDVDACNEEGGDNIVIDVDACDEEEEEVEKEDKEASDISIDVDAIHGSGNNEDDEKEEEEEEENTEAIIIKNRKQRGRKIGGKKGGSKKRASILGTGVHQGDNDVLRSELNKYVQTGNPYFVTQLRENRKDVLFVPEYVLREFGMFKLAKRITFRNEFGSKWAGKVVSWKDGRKWIKGWGAVCRCNNVCDDDYCICVFPQRGKVEKDAIDVRIVRGEGGRSRS